MTTHEKLQICKSQQERLEQMMTKSDEARLPRMLKSVKADIKKYESRLKQEQ